MCFTAFLYQQTYYLLRGFPLPCSLSLPLYHSVLILPVWDYPFHSPAATHFLSCDANSTCFFYLVAARYKKMTSIVHLGTCRYLELAAGNSIAVDYGCFPLGFLQVCVCVQVDMCACTSFLHNFFLYVSSLPDSRAFTPFSYLVFVVCYNTTTIEWMLLAKVFFLTLGSY